MEDAALYTDPYDINDICAQMERLTIAPAAQDERAGLVAKGQRVLQRYTPATVGKQWRALLEDIYAREKSGLYVSVPEKREQPPGRKAA